MFSSIGGHASATRLREALSISRSITPSSYDVSSFTSRARLEVAVVVKELLNQREATAASMTHVCTAGSVIPSPTLKESVVGVLGAQEMCLSVPTSFVVEFF